MSGSEKAYDAWQRVDALAGRVGSLDGLSAYKTSDLSRASTVTLAIDPDLQFTVANGGIYIADFHLITSGGGGASAGNFKFDWQTPGSSSLVYECTYTTVAPNLVEQEQVNSPGTASIAQTTGVGNNAPVRGTGLLTCTSGGLFGLLWAQGTLNATNSWLRAGSYLTARRIA